MLIVDISLSITPPPGPGPRQRLGRSALFPSISLTIGTLVIVVMGVVTVLNGRTDDLVWFLVLFVFFAPLTLFMYLTYARAHYQEFDEGFTLQATPFKESYVRYADIKNIMFKSVKGTRFVYVLDGTGSRGKTHSINLDAYKAPRVLTHLLVQAARTLQPYQLEELMPHLVNGFRIDITDQDIALLWDINAQRYPRS